MEAMVMSCDGALIGFAGTATNRLVSMQRAVAEGDYGTARRIWDRLGQVLLAAADPGLSTAH